MRLYSVFDKMRNEYNLPFGALNDDIASRDFGFACLKNPFYSDLELYYVGDFNVETGFLTCPLKSSGEFKKVQSAQFICNGASAVAFFKQNYFDFSEVDKNV